MTKGNYKRGRRWLALVLGLGVLSGFVAPSARAQQAAALNQVQAAFAAGNAEALIGAAADRVEIALLGRSRLYSRAQATYVMQDFFRRYPPEAFTLHHEAQDGGNWFATGQYEYRHAERPLQVYLRLRLKDERWELQEVRIEQRRGE